MASLELEIQGKSAEVKNLTNPIVVRIKNDHTARAKQIISLHMPGKITTHVVRITSGNCRMLISIEPTKQLKTNTNVTIYVQYGKPPTHVEYDAKITIRQMEATNNTIHPESTQNRSVHIVNTSNIRIIDDKSSIMMRNFTELKYGNSSTKNLYFAFVYHGLMPDLVYKENLYTFDTEPHRGAYNFTLQTYCAQCLYWDPISMDWQDDGVKVY